ncbi:MAG TPA: gluconate 2-dehydrogenase subunit 3 family protein [Nitrososphaerales archaeon]|nr:gluconate 2-dehydrogenase subunit 3 family protein [Nitrososphaerales archaeon]
MKVIRKRGPPFFLSPQEHLLVEALVEIIVPSGEDPAFEPGGREVGAHNYFDSRMLDLPEPARQMFRSVLRQVDEESDEKFGRPFVALAPKARDSLLRSLLLDPATMAGVFAVRAICLEGYYADYRDPSYAGKTAWEILDFKGKRIDGIKKDWSFLEVYRSMEGGG